MLSLAYSRERKYANRHIILHEIKTIYLALHGGAVLKNLAIFQCLEKFSIFTNLEKFCKTVEITG